LILIIKNLWLNFLGIGLLASLYGLGILGKERKILGTTFVGCVASIIIFFSFYDVVDNGQMIIPALIIFTLPMAVGVSRIYSGALINSSLYAKFIQVVMTLILFVEVSTNWTIVDRHQDWTAYDYSHQVMRNVGANAFIVTQWTAATPLEYVQIVEKSRADVEIFDRGLYVLGLQNQLSRNNSRDQVIIEKLVALINAQTKLRPVYVTENDPLLNDFFCLVPDGIIYRIQSAGLPAVDCAGDDY
jgi:hypothetical protein